MEFTYDYLLEELNTTVKPLGYEFSVIEREDGIDVLFLNGDDWEDYGLGYYDEEMPEVLFGAAIFVLRKVADHKINQHNFALN